MEKLKVLLKRRTVWMPIAVLGTLLLIFIIWGGIYYSRAYMIERYIGAYSRSGNTFENIKEYLVWSDTGEKVTNDEARYTNFAKLDRSKVQQLTKKLKAANASSDQFVKRVGHRWLIFPDYKIALKPISLTIKTNVSGVDVLLNKKKVATSDSEKYETLVKRLPAADYTASISGLYKNKKIELSKAFDGQDKTLDLRVTFKNFTVSSNLLDGELYFDDTRIGTLSDGHYEVTDYPVSDSARAYVKKTYSDGDVTSRKKFLSSITDGATVTMDVKDVLTEETAGKILVSAFDQLVLYLSKGQDPKDLAKVFEDGANNDFYKGLKESIKDKMQTDNRKASSLTIPNILLNQVTQVGKETYLLDFSATYDFYYDKSTDEQKKTEGSIVQTLVGQLTLKRTGHTYRVAQSGQKSITVTDEENQIKSTSIFPDDLIGTWIGKQEKNNVSMSFAEDGTVTLKIGLNGNQLTDSSHTAKVTKLEDKGNGLYHYIYEDGADVSAFVTDGIGGTGVKYTYGVRISGNTIKPVVWQTGINDDFDYSHPLDGPSLTKQ